VKDFSIDTALAVSLELEKKGEKRFSVLLKKTTTRKSEKKTE
jgi:hypothetical protein